MKIHITFFVQFNLFSVTFLKQETEEEMENEEDQRCLTPSNTYLELSFEHRGTGSPLNLGAIPKVNNLYKDLVHHSTPNNGMLIFSMILNSSGSAAVATLAKARRR